MKKIFPLLLIVILLAGCSGQIPDISQFLSTPTLVPTATNTPQPTVTTIPTRDLFATTTSTPVTFTPAPTSLTNDGSATSEFTLPTFAATETPFFTFVPPLASMEGSNFFTPKIEGFQRILVSDKVLYWNAGPCLTRNIKFNVEPEDFEKTYRVLLFVRLREKKNTLNVTDWNSGAIMFRETDGTFSYNLRTFNIVHYYSFADAWIEYQFVAIDDELRVIGRTQIYNRDISLVKCNPVP